MMAGDWAGHDLLGVWQGVAEWRACTVKVICGHMFVLLSGAGLLVWSWMRDLIDVSRSRHVSAACLDGH